MPVFEKEQEIYDLVLVNSNRITPGIKRNSVGI